MALFAIADLHLSLGTDKPMDVFGARWENAAEKLENNWRAAVRGEDTVVIAGDISWGMTIDEAMPDLRFLASLPGRKILLKGNHDYWWSTKAKLDAALNAEGLAGFEFMLNNAFSADEFAVCGSRGWNIFGATPQDDKLLAREVLRLGVSLKEADALGGEKIAFLHYPPLSPVSECRLFSAPLEEAGVRQCFYGHLHAGGKGRAFEGTKNGVTYRLISADVLDFMPVRVEPSK